MNIEDVHKYGAMAQGKAEVIKFIKGEYLTRKEAVKARCYECTNGYTDGKKDCKVPTCPLYGYMPYNPNKYAPKNTMTDEQKQAKSEHMRKIQRTHMNRTTK